MINCENCIHYSRCVEMYEAAGFFFDYEKSCCKQFSDRSEWVHLPCKVGDTVFTTYHGSLSTYKVTELIINDFLWAKLENPDYSREYKSLLVCLDYSFNIFVFLTREEAEKALRERENNDLS